MRSYYDNTCSSRFAPEFSPRPDVVLIGMRLDDCAAITIAELTLVCDANKLRWQSMTVWLTFLPHQQRRFAFSLYYFWWHFIRSDEPAYGRVGARFRLLIQWKSTLSARVNSPIDVIQTGADQGMQTMDRTLATAECDWRMIVLVNLLSI